jgi:hypothetical protein
MSVRETSGALQSHSPTAKEPGAVPGGRSRPNTDATKIRGDHASQEPPAFSYSPNFEEFKPT